MMNTAHFIQASPQQKEAMIKDGLAFLATEMEELERNMRVLTGWLATYPANVKLDYATMDKPVEVIASLSLFTRKMDDLTAQLVNVSIARETLMQFSRKIITQRQLQP